MTELTSAVREAQADADRRFGDGPVQPWEPPPVLSETTRRRLAVVALASVLATALLVAMAVAKTGPVVDAAPAASLPTSPAAPDADEDPAQDEAPPAPVPSFAPSMAAPPGVELERRGAQWFLSAQGAERHEVLVRLAEASGSTLHGSPGTVAGTRPVHLHWQGRSLSQLWPLVLGPELNFALQCRAERCQVWILGAARPGATSIAPALPSAGFEPAALPLPMPAMDQDGVPVRD